MPPKKEINRESLTNVILEKLGIKDFFPDLDLDLAILACTPRGINVPSEIGKRLNIRPKFLNMEALEFYGDSALDFIVIDEFRVFLGLNMEPGELTKVKSDLVKNSTLTEISQKMEICPLFNSGTLKKHNVCADNLEALIGAIYYQYGIRSFPKILNWLETFSTFREKIEKSFYDYTEINFEEEVSEKVPSFSFPKNKSLNDFLINYQKKYPQWSFGIIKPEEDFDPEEDLGFYRFVIQNNKTKKDFSILTQDTSHFNDKDIKDELIRLKIWK